jgi:hypothetical protein
VERLAQEQEPQEQAPQQVQQQTGMPMLPTELQEEYKTATVCYICQQTEHYPMCHPH